MVSVSSLSSAFLSDNARNETDENIVNCFIQTEVFWSLFNVGHTILYGSRGAGKTFISRMASFPLLRQSPHEYAKEIIQEKNYIGVFVNTDIRFVGSARSAMWTESEFSDLYFIWKFNLNCLKSLCVTIESVLEHRFGDTAARFACELEICSTVASMLRMKERPRLLEFPQIISAYESALREKMAAAFLSREPVERHLIGPFSIELLEPIQVLIDVFTKLCPDYCNTKWLFFIDEAEFLTVPQLKVINSFIRTHTGRISLKVATLPYHYRTFETNISTTLQEGDDYGVEILDASPIYALNSDNAKSIYEFARLLYERRVRHLQTRRLLPSDDSTSINLSSLDSVLGGSRLLAKKPRIADKNLAMEKLKDHLDSTTCVRAERLLNEAASFDDQIWRKISGPIALREEFQESRRGHRATDLYSGVELLVRCTDGVPRRMINVFHLIAREAARAGGRIGGVQGQFGSRRHRSILSYRAQNRILSSFGARRHANSLSVPQRGPELNKLIERLGMYFHERLHSGLISTDLVISFSVEDSCPEKLWDTVLHGVAYGHLFPNWLSGRPDTLSKIGTYRLSFCYAPHFYLYPTKGKAHSLTRIMHNQPLNERREHTPISKGQLDFFLDGRRV
ncbi:ORC-CDC6 family AAA ATPase [Methylobacterium marchantiae]|uniref:Uncharacterized protein n=1 Tax=Methylobacterium marchantiae TaxID=600331 RepID=A0ABW3WZD6_9HYPH|nr:hypothetical protein AIGOOFII_2974 [Methylobacterium marchantiae]